MRGISICVSEIYLRIIVRCLYQVELVPAGILASDNNVWGQSALIAANAIAYGDDARRCCKPVFGICYVLLLVECTLSTSHWRPL